MIKFITHLRRKTRVPVNWFVGLFACWFVGLSVLPLSAQDSGWNGYQPQQQKKPNNPAAQTTLNGSVPAGSEGVRFYLLRTGFLTEGTATNNGKQYILKTNFGTMYVPVANVEFVGETREDVYRYKKGFVNDGNCNELMKFAEWCFSNKLPQQGIAEYQQALKTAPNAVLADVIQKRLEMLQDSESASEISATSSNISEKSEDAGAGRWMNGIPKPIVDSFTKKVQPVLVSRCAATDCHGSASENPFKLGIPSHTLGNTTYRNLRSVIQWIDLDYPTESPLLSPLVTYHGGTKAAFSVESAQYNNIVQWVRLTAKELPNEYRSQLADQKNGSQSAPNQSASSSKKIVLPPALRNAIIADSPIEEPDKNVQKEIPATFLTSANSVSVSPQPNRMPPPNDSPTRLDIPDSVLPDSIKDPFDPKIFNARYHGAPNRSEIIK
ncbi:MAG: hypothetical protein LBQ50_03560 [Planctomycetaceae bacterium]|jgi:hypothetical protein|nr:hypothetical protein [Planctomycetaceae bacterium]